MAQSKKLILTAGPSITNLEKNLFMMQFVMAGIKNLMDIF